VAVAEGVPDSEPVAVLLGELVAEELAVCMYARTDGAGATRPESVHEGSAPTRATCGSAKTGGHARAVDSSHLGRCG
jgi:hypothetical protein